jgi:hypothetical protein
MARGTTLGKLLTDLRAECGVSLNPAHSPQDRDSYVNLLQRTQDTLWQDFAWPHLRVDRMIDVQAGQRYYDMPQDIDIDRIERIQVRTDSRYFDLHWGITADHYAAFDSEANVRSWPPQRVQIVEDEMLEIWPIPDSNFDALTLDGRIKITGIRKLKPLVATDDRADLDDRLLVLFAAAEYKAGRGADDAQIKQDKANRLYMKLRGGLMPRRVYDMLGVRNTTGQPKRVIIPVYRAGG